MSEEQIFELKHVIYKELTEIDFFKLEGVFSWIVKKTNLWLLKHLIVDKKSIELWIKELNLYYWVTFKNQEKYLKIFTENVNIKSSFLTNNLTIKEELTYLWKEEVYNFCYDKNYYNSEIINEINKNEWLICYWVYDFNKKDTNSVIFKKEKLENIKKYKREIYIFLSIDWTIYYLVWKFEKFDLNVGINYSLIDWKFIECWIGCKNLKNRILKKLNLNLWNNLKDKDLLIYYYKKTLQYKIKNLNLEDEQNLNWKNLQKEIKNYILKKIALEEIKEIENKEDILNLILQKFKNEDLELLTNYSKIIYNQLIKLIYNMDDKNGKINKNWKGDWQKKFQKRVENYLIDIAYKLSKSIENWKIKNSTTHHKRSKIDNKDIVLNTREVLMDRKYLEKIHKMKSGDEELLDPGYKKIHWDSFTIIKDKLDMAKKSKNYWLVEFTELIDNKKLKEIWNWFLNNNIISKEWNMNYSFWIKKGKIKIIKN